MKFLSNLTSPTLQKRVSLLVFLALALGLALFGWLGIQSLNESTQRTLNERLTVARMVANQLDKMLNQILVQLQAAAEFGGQLPPETQFRERAGALASLLARSDISVDSVFLLDPEGRVLQTEPRRPDSSSCCLYMPSAQVEAALTTRLPTISSLVYAPLTEAPVVFATTPVLDSRGKSIGALSVAIDVNESGIGGFIKPLTLGNTGYTEIVDSNGIVLARTEPGRPLQAFERSDHPGRFAQLIVAGKATVRTCHRCHGPITQPERRRDVLAFAPLTTTSWGVAVRQSEEEAFALTQQLRRRFLILGGIVVVSIFLLLWVMMQGIVKPIKVLTSAAAKVAAGDFKAALPVRRRDEIGQLSNAFASMTGELARARDELVSRNRELLALNSIATAVGQSLDLQDVLGKATQKVLEVTRSGAGWVFLGDGNGQELKLASHTGSSSLFDCQNTRSASAHCACHQVLRRGHTLLVNDASQCPALKEEVVRGEGLSSFACVSLKSKDKTLGVMNVACPAQGCFTENDFRLLDSIGYHVGLAIENSMLYQEAREKEELRGQLLNAAITAQEEERKRLSREMHDGCGQTLTGLIMRLESLEGTVSSQESPLSQNLANVRLLAVRTLEEMRRLTRDLRSTVLDDLGLVAAIRSYAETHLEAAGVSVELKAEGLGQRLPPSVETALFRIVQEAVNNIIRHAHARTARIQLKAEDKRIVATIEDDGRGFDAAALLNHASPSTSLGLLGMRERTMLLGGTFTVTSAIGQGTRIVVEVPLHTSEEEAGERKDASADS